MTMIAVERCNMYSQIFVLALWKNINPETDTIVVQIRASFETRIDTTRVCNVMRYTLPEIIFQLHMKYERQKL